MRSFTGRFEERLGLRVSPSVARDHFGDPDRIAAAFAHLDRADRVDERTLRVLLVPQNYGVTRFTGAYTVRYDPVGDDVLEWHTLGEGNVASNGRARFIADPQGCTVEYRETVSTTLDLGPILSRAIGPVVARMVPVETRAYIERIAAGIGGLR